MKLVGQKTDTFIIFEVFEALLSLWRVVAISTPARIYESACRHESRVVKSLNFQRGDSISL